MNRFEEVPLVTALIRWTLYRVTWSFIILTVGRVKVAVWTRLVTARCLRYRLRLSIRVTLVLIPGRRALC